MCPRVLLLKEKNPDEGNCKYGTTLESNGCSCFYCPVIATEIVRQGMNQLTNAFEQVAGGTSWWGVVLTSQRASQAVCQVVKRLELNRDQLGALKWFVVGKATAAPIEALGLKVIGGSQAGSASLLAPFVTEHYGQEKARERDDLQVRKLLFVAGNIRKDTIPQHLQTQCISYEEICVYKTSPVCLPQFPAQFLSGFQTTDQAQRYVVFFSPSGVECVQASSKSIGFDPRQVTLVAIGKTTAKALHESPFAAGTAVLVAAQPSPEGVLAEIQRHDDQDGIET